MNAIDKTIHSTDEECHVVEGCNGVDVTDEALESAAVMEAIRNFSQGVCTAFTVCPEH